MKVFIAGASSDIGLEVCKKFASSGWNVVAHCAHESEKLKMLQNQFSSKIEILKIDFGNPELIENLIDRHEKYFYGCASYINCIGFLEAKDYSNLTSVDLCQHFKINVVSSILMINKVVPDMIENKFGRILNLSSIGIKFGGSKDTFAYSLSKHCLEFIPSIYRSWAEHNVLINTLRVGVTNTKIHQLNKEKDIESRVEKIPVKRMAEPKEISKMIWMLSTAENSFITGQVVSISGGE